MQKQKIMKRFSALLACAVVATGLLGMTASADTSSYVPDDSIAVFATDRHDNATIITEVLSAVHADGLNPGFVGLGGDMVGDGPPIAEDYAPEFNTSMVQGEVHSALSSDVQVSILMAGHDQNAIDDAEILVDTARGFEVGDYYVFIIPEAFMDDEEAAQAGVADFLAWAQSDEVSIEKPIVVLSHMPIHQLRGDNVGAVYWHEAINQVATAGNEYAIRNVIVFHGHNHTASTEEFFYPVGSQMAIEGFGEDGESPDNIHYTYITAGYLVDNGTATVVDLDDEQITFYKYTTDGGTTLGTTPALSGEAVAYTIEPLEVATDDATDADSSTDTSEEDADSSAVEESDTTNTDKAGNPAIIAVCVIVVIVIIAIIAAVMIRKRKKQ